MKPIATILLILCIATYLTHLMLQDSQLPPTEATASHNQPNAATATQVVDVSNDPIDHLPKKAMILSHMNAIEHCEDNQDCPFPKTDPKAVYFAVGKALQKDLQLLALHANEEPSPILQDTARTYFMYQNDHVREAALNLMATQPPSPENIPVVLQGLADSHDASIYRMALVEFQRYPDEQSQQQIHHFLSETLITGGLFAKRSIASHLLPLLTNDNIELYRQVLTKLPPSQSHSRTLQQIIEEFDRQQQGG